MLQNATASNFFVAKLRDRRWVLLMIAATLSLSGAAYSLWRVQSSTPVAKSPMIVPEIKTVTALGRLEPTGEVIKLSAPTSSNGNRVDQSLVKEGDQVKKGQVFAILDTPVPLKAPYDKHKEDVKVLQPKLVIPQQGQKKGEI